MPSERYFLFLWVKEPELAKRCLDLAIWVANPSERWPAHVTVAGPYKDRDSAPTKRVFSSKLHVEGVGNFFDSGRNTVFLKVNSPRLEVVWDKPDFGFNPHLTIYDGPDQDFARKLFSQLESISLRFWLSVTNLQLVTSVKGQSAFNLDIAADWQVLEQVMRKAYLQHLPDDEDAAKCKTIAALLTVAMLSSTRAESGRELTIHEALGSPETILAD